MGQYFLLMGQEELGKLRTWRYSRAGRGFPGERQSSSSLPSCYFPYTLASAPGASPGKSSPPGCVYLVTV